MSDENEVWVYFRGGPWNGYVRSMPDKRNRWAVPHRPEMLGAFFFGTSLGPMPQPAMYERAYPLELETALSHDVIVKRGTLIKNFNIDFVEAQVFDYLEVEGL